MAKKNRTPEEKARRAKSRELLQMTNIGSMDDIQNLFKETIAEFMENGLEAELDDELGYSKYDYKNKDTDNSRNGHSSKTLRTSFGDVEVSVPRDRKGEFEPQVLKKNQTSISQDIEEKILSMYAKGMTTGDIETHIQDIYGISPEECVAFGDYMNDYEMLQNCGESYAMENAHDEIKKVAKYIAPSNDDEGVMQVLKKIL